MLKINFLNYIRYKNNGIILNFFKFKYCILYEKEGGKSNNKNKQCIC